MDRKREREIISEMIKIAKKYANDKETQEREVKNYLRSLNLSLGEISELSIALGDY